MQHAAGAAEGVSYQRSGGQTHLLTVRRTGGRRQRGQLHPGFLQPGEPGVVPAPLLRLRQPAAAAGLPVSEHRHQSLRRPRPLERPRQTTLPPPALHVLRVPRPPARPPEPDLRRDLRPALQSSGRPSAEGPASDPSCHQRVPGVQRVEGELSALPSTSALRLPDERHSEGFVFN